MENEDSEEIDRYFCETCGEYLVDGICETEREINERQVKRDKGE